MTANHALDNDIVLKLAYFGLLDHLLEALRPHGDAAVLGTARFVARQRVTTDGVVDDIASTLTHLRAFLAVVEQLEPTPSEVLLATQLEDVALRQQLELDAGESLLCSMVVHRTMSRLLTGDKRAIRAVEVLVASRQELSPLQTSLACLEQVMVTLAVVVGPTELRAAVCGVPAADKALAACFSCRSPEVDDSGWVEGVTSYIEHLRATAGTVLVAGLAVWTN